MAFEEADIDINEGADSHIRLTGVAYHFSPGERSLYSGADGSVGTVQRAGWLGLKTEPFKGWLSAQTISTASAHGARYLFEVKRNFHNPLQDGEWLWFPASRVAL